MKIDDGVELARFTTLGTGGPARAFARPESEREVEELLRWAAERDLAVAVVGLGSNLLAADDGIAAVEPSGESLEAGGGAPNAVVLHRARAAGLGGFEFACAIPGTIGGGVWMNGGAYGGDFADRLRLVKVPACALQTPDAEECRQREFVPVDNDTSESALRRAHEDAEAEIATTIARIRKPST